MSKRSCSRGTWECSSTEKPRIRPRGDADVVTLATARYLELFATTPKNDETSTVLSEVPEAQDSLRSARTASEHQGVSRSSTFTGRASREPSRLGPSQPQQQQSSPPAALPPASSQRFPAWRGTSENMSSSASPGRDAAPPPPGQTGAPAYGRKTGSASHVTAQGPFTNKTRAPGLGTSRCRSDRISPSTAAYLLPAPSARAIARAHTAITTGSGGMPSSTSLNDLCSVPADTVGGAGYSSSAAATAACGFRPQEHASASSSHITQAQADAGRHAPAVGRRSRLQTESGGTAGPVAAVVGAQAAAPTSASPSDLGAAAQEWVQNHNQLARSNTVGRGNGRRPLPRRPSILFTRDGDVTVTGLPPSCLTAGRAPRCRAADTGPSPFMMSTGVCSTMNAEVSAPVLCSALFVAGGSVDSSSARSGGCAGGAGGGAEGGSNISAKARRNSGGCVGESSTPAMFLTSRSNDPGSRGAGGAGAGTSVNTNASEVGLSVPRMQPVPARQRQAQYLGGGNGGGGRDRGMCTGVSVSCGANAVFVFTDAAAAMNRGRDGTMRSTQQCCGTDGEPAAEFEGFGEEEPVQRRLQQQRQESQRQRQKEQGQQQQQQPQQQDVVPGKASESGQGELDGRMGQVCPERGPGAGQEAEHTKRVERTRQHVEPVGPQALAYANSSSEGQRCDWGGSSMFAPSRFSDSSRLTHGLTAATATATPATASVHSNNPLLEACTTAAAAAASAAAAAAAVAGPQAPQAANTTTDSPLAAKASPSSPEAVATAGIVADGAEGTAVAPAGCGPPTGLLPAGSVRPSLLTIEARDVTSALNRLQEACLAAVAQGDLRSQRLCHRVSTELPLLGTDLTSALIRIGDGGGVAVGRSLVSGGGGFGGDGGERGSSMGPLRIAASLGGAAGRPGGARAGPAFRPSASLPRIAVVGPRSSLQEQPRVGGAAGQSAAGCTSLGGSVTLAMEPSLMGHAVEAAQGAVGEGEGEPCAWGGDRPSPDGAGIIIDGAVLQRARFSAADAVEEEPELFGDDSDGAEAGAGARAGPSAAQPGGGDNDVDVADAFDDPDTGEEYRNRVLNVLLRSDFLHDTFEAASEDDDEGVVEYRYGGFELGGGDNDCGFARQASFMEAVRKCGTAKAAASAVGLDPSQVRVDAGAGAAAGSSGGVFHSSVLRPVGRQGPNGGTLTRMGSCLAAAAVASPVP